MADLGAAAAAVRPERLAERPAPEEGSGNEVMAPVVMADSYFAGGIRDALAGRPAGPQPTRRGVEDAPLRSAQAWYEALAGQRETLFAEVLAADPAAAPDRRIEHPAFRPLSWRDTPLFTPLHDPAHAGHLPQIATPL